MDRASTSRPAWAAVGVLVLGYLAVDVVAGAVRSPLVPPLPASVSTPRYAQTAARWMGLRGLGRTGLAALSVAILAVLVGAFAVAAWEAWKGRVAVPVAGVTLIVSLAVAVAAPVLLSRDVYSYAAYGRTLSVHHANPYSEPPSAFPLDPFTPIVSTEWIHTRSVYGPAFTLTSAGLTRAWSNSPFATLLSFKILAALGIGLAALFAARAAHRVRPGRESTAIVLVGLNPVVVVHTVGGGHNDAIVAGLLAAGFLLALRGPAKLGPALGVTAILTLAALVKIVAAIPLGLWLWEVAKRTDARDRARIVGWHGAAILALTAAVTAPVFAGWRTVTAILNLASRQGWASGARLVARGARAIGRTLGGSNAGSASALVVYAAFLVLFAALAWRLAASGGPTPPDGSAMRRSGDRRALVWGSTLLLFGLAAPYLLPWYTVWFLPFLALIPEAPLVVAGMSVGAVLALTGVPAEPATDPSLWRAMTLGVHYGAAPIMLALFLYVARRVLLLARLASGIGPKAPAGGQPAAVQSSGARAERGPVPPRR